MKKLNRRELLRLSAGAALAAGATPLLNGCGEETAETEPAPSPTSPSSAAKVINPSAVAAVKGTDLAVMAREALEALGGIGTVVNEGESVFIKPNFVTLGWAQYGRNPFVTGECTKVELVAAVAEECLKVGASEVTIGDGGQVPTWDWAYATTLDGSTNLKAIAEQLSAQYGRKVTLACLETDSPGWDEVPSKSEEMGKIAVSNLVTSADRIISIPVLKTHQWAQLTLALKNFTGTTPLARYGANNDGTRPRILLHLASGGIEQCFLDVVTAVRPDLAIIDASICVEGDGPSAGGGKGLTVDMKQRLGSWLLLASRDLVAIDATTARIISHDVLTVKHIGMAYEQGLGEMRVEEIELVGARLDDLRVDWVAATPASPTELSRHQQYCPFTVAHV